MAIWYSADEWILFKDKALPVPKNEIIETKRGSVKPNRMGVMSFKIPHEFSRKLDHLVKTGIFISRSEAVRYSIQYYLQSIQNTD